MAKTARVGQAVSYRVPEVHHTETTIANAGEEKRVMKGSVHHSEQREFAGLVGRVHADGSADLVIFPPNKAATWVDGVKPDDFSAV